MSVFTNLIFNGFFIMYLHTISVSQTKCLSSEFYVRSSAGFGVIIINNCM